MASIDSFEASIYAGRVPPILRISTDYSNQDRETPTKREMTSRYFPTRAEESFKPATGRFTGSSIDVFA